MAQRRMFSLSVTDTDAFQDMPTSAQALYFHLGMHGDDDGFVGSPKKITRGAGCNDDDLKVLIAKGFVIPFDSGVVVIRDWRLNNTLQNDRYKPTVYLSERSKLSVDESKRYVFSGELDTTCIQPVSNSETQPNLTEPNGTEPNGEKTLSLQKKPRQKKFSPPSVDEVMEYCTQRGNSVDADRFVDYYSANGWMLGRNHMRDWKAAVRTWEKGGKTNGHHVDRLRGNSESKSGGEWGDLDLYDIK